MSVENEKLNAVLEAHEVETTMPQIKNMTKSAWQVYELMMLNPTATQAEIARTINVSRAYVSRIQNSRIFKETLRESRIAAVQDRLVSIANTGLTKCADALEDKDVGIKHKIEITKLAMTGLGLGANQGTPAVSVTNVVGVSDLGVTRQMVEEAAARRRNRIFEGEVVVPALAEASDVRETI